MSDHETVIELASADQIVGVVPSCGGGLSHWRHRRSGIWRDLLRPATPRALQRNGPLALGCFPLVPYSNRIRDGRFRFAGEEIRLPLNFGDHPHAIHGHGWQASWRIQSRTESRIELSYRHEPDAWPFAYEAGQIVEVCQGGLALTVSLTNRADRPMPAGLGFHPYFAGAGQARIAADVDGVWLTDDEILPTTWTALPPRWNLPAGVAVAGMASDNLFTGWRGEAVIARPDLGLHLRLFAGGPLSHLVVYAPSGEDFFCVEPVSHITDAFNLAAAGMADTGIAVLAPGETLIATMRIHVDNG